jgi:8-oxo-dGTP diphosphatase
MLRETRYQGAIIRDQHILLISHTVHATGNFYWAMPGGGIEPGESEEDCVRREMKEETCLDVQVERLMFHDPGEAGGVYRWINTYLCSSWVGEAMPGYEPESEASSQYAISQVRWVDLSAPHTWGRGIDNNRFVYPLLLRICAELKIQPRDS